MKCISDGLGCRSLSSSVLFFSNSSISNLTHVSNVFFSRVPARVGVLGMMVTAKCAGIGIECEILTCCDVGMFLTSLLVIWPSTNDSSDGTQAWTVLKNCCGMSWTGVDLVRAPVRAKVRVSSPALM